MQRTPDWNAMARPTMENSLHFELECLDTMEDDLIDAVIDDVKMAGAWSVNFVTERATGYIIGKFLRYVDGIFDLVEFESNQGYHMKQFLCELRRTVTRELDFTQTRYENGYGDK